MSNKRKAPKTLVIGAGGFLGSYFLEAYRKVDPETLGTMSPEELDLSKPCLNKLDVEGYEYAVIAAGITSIAACETEKETTRLSNVSGTLELVKQLQDKEIVPILFSTDYVFDGIDGNYDENSPLNPLNEYGRQKADLQKGVQEICGENFLLIRPSKVFGEVPGDGTLLDEMATKLKKNEPVFAAYDQIFCPVTVSDVIEGALSLQKMGSRGIFHICGQTLSRYEIAQEIAQKLGAPLSLVKSISLDDLKETFKRPKNTSMVSEKFRALTEQTFKSVHLCIDELTSSCKSFSK